MHLQKYLFITVILALPLFLKAQPKPDTASQISFIQKQRDLINNRLPVYRKVVKEDMGQSTEGGEVTAYFDGANLKQITANYYGETFKETQEYYFYHGKPVFCYGIRYHYKVPINVDSKAQIDSTFVSQFYIYNNALIKYKIVPVQKLLAAQLKSEVKNTMVEVARLMKLIGN